MLANMVSGFLICLLVSCTDSVLSSMDGKAIRLTALPVVAAEQVLAN